ncbi:enoyl-CoA hydratase/isomerase family protein [Nitriliruptor alkaliphilus]|uniref:enoyl-CoA hydratase/isomerase family protein n=1 Tax=Nitriliruptor alkaliphilus TaxID=427918 RepID=UPI00146FE7E0|nr:enoyl-CoA hydratase-related protein [Nitriliruptor alkaliphilus]
MLHLDLDTGPGNPLGPVAAAELDAARTKLSDARAIVLTASGDDFCFGADARAIISASSDDELDDLVDRIAAPLHGFVGALVAADVPTVAGVTGWATGIGMSLACACDLVIVEPTTRFRSAYPTLGFTPDGGLTWTLPRRIGRSRATELLLADRVVDGVEAVGLGLATRLAGVEGATADAVASAHQLAAGPTRALAVTKQLVEASCARSVGEQLDEELAAVRAAAKGPEGRAGRAAAASRTTPEFRTWNDGGGS